MKNFMLVVVLLITVTSTFGQSSWDRKRASNYKKIKNLKECYLSLKEDQFGNDSVISTEIADTWPEFFSGTRFKTNCDKVAALGKIWIEKMADSNFQDSVYHSCIKKYKEDEYYTMSCAELSLSGIWWLEKAKDSLFCDSIGRISVHRYGNESSESFGTIGFDEINAIVSDCIRYGSELRQMEKDSKEDVEDSKLNTFSVICLPKANFYLEKENAFVTLPDGQFENVCVIIPGKNFYLAPNQLIQIVRLDKELVKNLGLERMLFMFPKGLKYSLYFAWPGKYIYKETAKSNKT